MKCKIMNIEEINKVFDSVNTVNYVCLSCKRKRESFKKVVFCVCGREMVKNE